MPYRRSGAKQQAPVERDESEEMDESCELCEPVHEVSEETLWRLVKSPNFKELLRRMKKTIATFDQIGVVVVPTSLQGGDLDEEGDQGEDAVFLPDDFPKGVRSKALEMFL